MFCYAVLSQASECPARLVEVEQQLAETQKKYDKAKYNGVTGFIAGVATVGLVFAIATGAFE